MDGKTVRVAPGAVAGVHHALVHLGQIRSFRMMEFLDELQSQNGTGFILELFFQKQIFVWLSLSIVSLFRSLKNELKLKIFIKNVYFAFEITFEVGPDPDRERSAVLS